MRAYSERFLAVDQPGAWAYWLCPSGYRAVLKSIVGYSGAVAGAALMVRASNVMIYRNEYTREGQSSYQETRAVCYPGEGLELYVSNLNMWASIHGYLFADDTGLLSAPGETGLRVFEHPSQSPLEPRYRSDN